MKTCKDCLYRAMCYKHEHYGYEDNETCEMFKNKADFVEVKYGCWQIEDRGGKPTDKPICSQCGATPKYYVNGESSPYCQECGSKMERKVKPYAG